MLRPERGFDSRGISLAVAQQSIWWRRAREQAAQLHGGRELATMIEGVADRGGIFLGDNEHVRKHGSADHDRQAGFDVPHVLRLHRRQLRPDRDEANRASLLLLALLLTGRHTGHELLATVEPVTGAERTDQKQERRGDGSWTR
jgi:hypothetical protein